MSEPRLPSTRLPMLGFSMLAIGSIGAINHLNVWARVPHLSLGLIIIGLCFLALGLKKFVLP